MQLIIISNVKTIMQVKEIEKKISSLFFQNVKFFFKIKYSI